MQRSTFAVLAAVAAFPIACLGQSSCLWLNGATASAILDGPVNVTVTAAKKTPPKGRSANSISSAGPLSADPESNSYSTAGMDDSDCTFVRKSSGMSAELRIDVHTMSHTAKEYRRYSSRCSHRGMPLKAVGNEAVTCSLPEKSGQRTEEVIGRVRDRAFLVRLSVTDSSTTRELLREKVRKVADQVAGNLF
jgi:hypothetical protein